jgi:hypothetical protein
MRAAHGFQTSAEMIDTSNSPMKGMNTFYFASDSLSPTVRVANTA